MPPHEPDAVLRVVGSQALPKPRRATRIGTAKRPITVIRPYVPNRLAPVTKAHAHRYCAIAVSERGRVVLGCIDCADTEVIEHPHPYEDLLMLVSAA